MSNCVPAEQNQGHQPFLTAIVEYILLRVPHTQISYMEKDGKVSIDTGDFQFQGIPKEEAIGLFLRHVAFKPELYSSEQRQVAEQEQRQTEAQKDEALINDLTKGGMSPLGKATELMRADRKTKIVNALREMQMVAYPTMAQVQQDLVTRTGLEDIDAAEVLAAYRDLGLVTP
jgi:hypothetical protein